VEARSKPIFTVSWGAKRYSSSEGWDVKGAGGVSLARGRSGAIASATQMLQKAVAALRPCVRFLRESGSGFAERGFPLV